MPEIFVVHRRDPHNIGDMACPPSDHVEHFPWLADATTIDIEHDIPRYADRLRHAHVIYGGGGLLGTGFFDRQLDHLLSLRPPKLVVWGAGHNNNERHSIEELQVLDRFDLVGLRDRPGPGGREWVPCTSALLPELDDPGEPRHDVVAYRHRDRKLPFPADLAEFPMLTNGHHDLGETLDFLASGEVVVTNSYHGAYWATLLGRRVVVVDPFASKFHGFRHRVPVVDGRDWRTALADSRTYPDALRECRAAVLGFGDRVRELFGR
ncbi:polysaccharide pyruvyl transferase family protein [Saccharopolyspora gregorii]|uniref:polysaccharide pyruvyl transferase family protein n=1 Tax=Saccharopolyspora gregorii TaxID=33914 RepID=UPI0021AC2A39|nr:polysaccharide pyruvyl transferase family protein [Saccharopolyspora gregorii]